jgi:lysophospholipase L1-like esterase
MTISIKERPQYACLAVLILTAPAFSGPDDNGVRYYVSLGTSLSVGIQPDATGANQPTDEGYADQLFDIIEPDFRQLRLVKLGCSGETTTTMIAGGICNYPRKSQLAEAVRFLHAHKDKVELVTIDVGVNDILSAGCIVGTEIDVTCLQAVFFQVSVNLPVILSAMSEAAAPETPILGMNYYNPFLASWLTGPAGEVLAVQSAELSSIFSDDVLAATYGAFGIPVADVADAYLSDDFATMVPFPTPDSPLSVPLNVAVICQLTYMCMPAPVGPNIHANEVGYGVIAATFAALLDDVD